MQNSKITYFRILSLEIVSASFYCSSSEGEKCRARSAALWEGSYVGSKRKASTRSILNNRGTCIFIPPTIQIRLKWGNNRTIRRISTERKELFENFWHEFWIKETFFVCIALLVREQKVLHLQYEDWRYGRKGSSKMNNFQWFFTRNVSHPPRMFFHLITTLRILTRMCLIWLGLVWCGCVEIPKRIP